MLTGVFDPAPAHLAVPWTYLGVGARRLGAVDDRREHPPRSGRRADPRTSNSCAEPRIGEAPRATSATDLDDLYAELLRSGGVTGRPLSMSTVHHVHTAIGKLLHDAERKGLVVRNVARLADAPSMAAARDRAPDMNVWTPDELSRFLRYAENYRAGALVHLAAMPGMRRGELVALRWDAVDLRRSTVKVRAAATYLGGVETIDVPKTKRSRRTIDLDLQTVSVMKRHRATQREELFELGITSPTDDRVFANEIGEPMRPHSVGQAFNRLVESSGIPRIRLHDLRHTHASHCSPPA